MTRSSNQFVRRRGSKLMLGTGEFKIVGANNYYVAYVENSVARAVFDLAQSLELNVIRLWAFCERVEGNPVFFQSWETGAPVYNEEGLRRLDNAIALAAERGIRVILTLSNNWKDFGGMPAYLRWFGLSGHDQFYRDGRCRAAYWMWLLQLLNRTNSVSGQVYKDDPAILAWELSNEPRCSDAQDGEALLLSWVWEMATLLKAHAPRHLVAVGDEGYFHRRGAGKNALFNGSHGVNFEALLGVGPVDFGTYHMYGEWADGGDLVEFGQMWIQNHIDAGVRADKPVLLEEYGAPLNGKPLTTSAQRAGVYEAWLQLIEQSGSLGDLLWMLGLPQGPGQPYTPDSYVIGQGPELDVIRAHGRALRASEALNL